MPGEAKRPSPSLVLVPGGGRLLLNRCPGRDGSVREAIAGYRACGATCVVSLVEDHEFPDLAAMSDALAPSPRASAAASAAAGPLMSATTMRAPLRAKSSTQARPMPVAAPIIRARFPASLIPFSSFIQVPFCPMPARDHDRASVTQ